MTEATTTHRVREYETIYILRPDVTREAQERVATRMGEVLGRGEGGPPHLDRELGPTPARLPGEEEEARRLRVLEVHRRRQPRERDGAHLGVLDDVMKFQTIQLRDSVDAGTVTVDPEAVKFEAVDPPQPGEDEGERIEQILGFERSPERSRSDDGDSFGDEDGDYSMNEDVVSASPQSVAAPAVAEVEK